MQEPQVIVSFLPAGGKTSRFKGGIPLANAVLLGHLGLSLTALVSSGTCGMREAQNRKTKEIPDFNPIPPNPVWTWRSCPGKACFHETYGSNHFEPHENMHKITLGQLK